MKLKCQPRAKWAVKLPQGLQVPQGQQGQQGSQVGQVGQGLQRPQAKPKKQTVIGVYLLPFSLQFMY